MTVEIRVATEPTADDVAAVREGLVAYNVAAIGNEAAQPLAVFGRQDGELVGGVTAYTHSGWLFVQYLWVASAQRGSGLGRDLLTQAETEAHQRGCHAVWLDTFSFQAPGFYRRLGYQEFGRLDDFPPGYTRHFLWKRLDARPKGQQSGASAAAG